ncbi:MAG TPA: HDOD domain-containing protein [Acidobacteriaceae bacterium]|nr:HDOD domain-containing protein [Acidobacteriaceae bacterium]
MDVAVSSAAGEAEEQVAATPSRLLARQTIFNGRCEVTGYELLFREGWENSFDGKANEATLARMLFTGIELLTNNKLAFVSCTRAAILNNLVTLLPAKSAVIEIAEPGAVDDELLQACVNLREMGYRLALDEFMPKPELAPLIEIAEYVKVDFRQSDTYTRRQIYRMVRNTGAALLANRLETQQQFIAARSEGYEFFQGPFFSRPTMVPSHDLPTNRLSYIRLLAELNKKPLNLRDVTDIVQLEPSLAYRVLRLANSAMFARGGQVTSIQAAFMLVGEERFRALVSVAASCALAERKGSALISLSLERARFCELVAPLAGEDRGEQFMLGLLSLLDTMLEMPMASIVKPLPLREEAKAALMGTDNKAALPLTMIRNLESGTWGKCAAAAETLGIEEDAVAALYMESVKWATESLVSLQ